MNSTMYRRLKKLEVRFEPGKAPVEHVIRFVDMNGAVDGTLVLRHGGPARESQVSAGDSR